jgi:hypothetical protein
MQYSQNPAYKKCIQRLIIANIYERPPYPWAVFYAYLYQMFAFCSLPYSTQMKNKSPPTPINLQKRQV